MADEGQRNLLKEFREVTGVEEERARFYLEAANWQLQPALGGFYEGGDLDGMEDEDDDAGPQLPQPPRPTPAQMGGPPPVVAAKAAKATKTAPRTGVMTMDALRNAQETDSSEEDDDDKQAFYAGGSMSSGQQVLGPSKNQNNPNEVVTDMINKAREMGAQEVSPQKFKRKTGPGAGGGGAFGGTGYKLGDETSDGGSSESSAAAAAAATGPPPPQDVVLHLWSDGFTLDEGPFRSYTDEANLAFLNSVKKGEVPAELRQKLVGQDCTLSIMDKRGEDYTPPRGMARQAFTGRGQTLGSPTPATVTTSSSASATAAAGATPTLSEAEEARKMNETAARQNVALVPESPTTSIQFRLTDGSRLAAQFNHTHTVQDLHSFINTARPEYSNANYILTLFPNVQLTNKESSLKDANILNSSLIQKLQK